MARFLTLDTSFLVDLERERRAGTAGPAHRCLQGDPDVELGLSIVALGELAEGYGNDDRPVLTAIRKTHRMLDVDEDVAMTYGRITRSLRATGADHPTDHRPHRGRRPQRRLGHLSGSPVRPPTS